MARLLSGRVGPVRQEEAGEDPLERHHRGPHPQRESPGGGGGGRLRRGFAALGGVALTGELDNVPEMLAVTDNTVKDVAIGAVRYAGSVGKLLG